MFKPQTFYSVLAPMYYTFKIFGLAPFKITKNGFKKSKINLIFSMILLSCTFICDIILLHNKHVLATSMLTALPDLISSSLSPLSMFVYTLFGCIFNNKIIQAIRDISLFDVRTSFLGFDLNQEYRRSKVYLMLGLLATICYTMLSFTMSISLRPEFEFQEFIQTLILFNIPMMVNAFVNLQFSVVVLCLKQRFRWLNQRLATNSRDSQTRKDQIKVEKPINEEYQKISQIFEIIRANHSVLCKICNEINTCYSVQLLFIVIRSFVTLITGLFYSCRFLIFHITFTAEYALYNIIQLSLAMVELIVVTIACASTSAEARKTGTLIHNTMNFSKECKQKIKLQISFFSLQLLHQNVKFTACRIFEINESLLLTIVGAISTYLVIVIQFQIQDYKLITASMNLTKT